MSEEQRLCSQSLNAIRDALYVEKDQIELQENGFDWFPGSHTVRIRAQAGGTAGRIRLTAETDFLIGMPAGDSEVIAMLDTAAYALTSTFSLVHSEGDNSAAQASIADAHEPRKLRFFSSAYVNSDIVHWLPLFFARMALMQPIEAERRAATVAARIGVGNPHFRSRKNPSPDEILTVADSIYEPAGRARSRWATTSEFEQFTETYARQDYCFGTGGTGGMTLETPFGSDSALILFLTEDPHPTLGHGLVIGTQIDIRASIEDVRAEAIYANYLEAHSWTDFPQFGCWHTRQGARGAMLAHTCFIPNALFAPNLITNMAMWAVARVRWYRTTRFPDVQDRTMPEILSMRIRLVGTPRDDGAVN